jgi:hypothetical protein
MLKIYCNTSCFSEKKWSFKLLFQEFLGVNFNIIEHYNNTIIIKNGRKKISMPDVFFINAGSNWLKKESLPKSPLKVWNLKNTPINSSLIIKKQLPILFGNSILKIEENNIHLGLDIFGSTFFMLSRYEEVVNSVKDSHQRFPAHQSIAFKEDFLLRPIINEYLEILWFCLKYNWPNLKRKKRISRILVSCDVDNPYEIYSKSIYHCLKRIGGDLYKRRNLLKAIDTGVNFLSIKKHGYSKDPFYSKLKWIMDVNEAVGNKVSFFFLTNNNSKFDSYYEINEPHIKNLLIDIDQRGHFIGIHGNYKSYNNHEVTQKGIKNLYNTLNTLKINQPNLGSRQHYLRWNTAESIINLEKTNLSYDTTLSFADHPGFRCGICYEYPLYNLIDRRETQLIERPLILMECSVISNRYMNLGYSQKSFKVMSELKKICLKFNGDFTLLWHNSHFQNDEDCEFYKNLIKLN